MACRDVKKAEKTVTDIVDDVKGDNLGQLVVEELDLASFASIKRCAKRILEKENEIHLLVNNAGQCVRGDSFIKSQNDSRYNYRHNGVSQGQDPGRIRDSIRRESLGTLSVHVASVAANSEVGAGAYR